MTTPHPTESTATGPAATDPADPAATDPAATESADPAATGSAATGPTGPTDSAAGPAAPSTRAPRVLALCGFLLLAGCLVLTAVLGLIDAVEGDGTDDGFLAAGFWALALGAAAGAAALAVPRRALVAAQYALAFAGPFLAALD